MPNGSAEAEPFPVAPSTTCSLSRALSKHQARRSFRMNSFGENHWDRLVVGPDDYAGGLPLVEGVERFREGDDDGPRDGFACLNFGFWCERGLRAGLQGRECLEVSVEVDGRHGVGGGVSAGRLDRGLQRADVEDLVARIVNGEGERGHGGVLPGDVHGGDIVESAGSLRLGTLQEGSEGDDDAEHDDGNDKDLARGKILFGGAVFFADVDGWA